MDKKFPYYARFDSIVKATVDKTVDKYLSKASLEDLKTLDISTVVDLEKNIDLIGTIFNAAVINRLNRNDDGIATATAIKIKDMFVHKPHNLEHKSNRIVGHIVKAGWSSFGDNKMLSDEEVAKMDEPFNLVLGGVVYTLVDEKFAELLLDASDETSDAYMSIATSWELGFTEYHLVVGSKNINEAEIISDPAKIDELKQYLKCNGGMGKLPDGRYIGRLIVGEVGDLLPVGMAFTTKPAAEVSGVITTSWVDLLSPEDQQQLVEQNDASIQNNKENSSQTIETDVKNNSQAKSIPMKLKDIKELLAAASSKDGLSEATVAQFIAEKIEEASKDFEAKAAEKANALKATADKATVLESELSKANAKIAEVTASLEKIEKDMSAKQKAEDFQTRMSAIASEFELSAKESELVAKQVREVGDEKAYASWFENFSVFAESKKKTSIAAAKAATEAAIEEAAKKAALAEKEKSTSTAAVVTQVSKASEEATKEKAAAEIATAALDNAKEVSGQTVANTNDLTKSVDSKKEWADAFGGANIKISV